MIFPPHNSLPIWPAFGWLKIGDVSPEFHHLTIRALEPQVRLSSFPVALPPNLCAWTELVNHPLLWGCRKAYCLFTKQLFTSKGWDKIYRKESWKEQTFIDISERAWTLESKDPYLNPRSATYLLGNLSKSLPCSGSQLPPPLENEVGNIYLTGLLDGWMRFCI